MKESRLPTWSGRSPGRWRLTGTFTRMCSALAWRAASQLLIPPVTTARTTSFTVTPGPTALPASCSSATGPDSQSTVRPGPTRAARGEVSEPGSSSRRTAATSRLAWAGARCQSGRARRSSPPSSDGRRRAARPNRSNSRSLYDGVRTRGAGSAAAVCGSASHNSADRIRSPLMPSAMQWCSLQRSAVRPPRQPGHVQAPQGMPAVEPPLHQPGDAAAESVIVDLLVPCQLTHVAVEVEVRCRRPRAVGPRRAVSEPVAVGTLGPGPGGRRGAPRSPSSVGGSPSGGGSTTMIAQQCPAMVPRSSLRMRASSAVSRSASHVVRANFSPRYRSQDLAATR